MFDKTGTLTKGSFAVTKITPADGASEEEVLRLAAIAEQNSSHPIAKSVVARYGKPTEGGYTLTNIAGEGVSATDGRTVILCGNAKLMEENDISYTEETGKIYRLRPHCG